MLAAAAFSPFAVVALGTTPGAPTPAGAAQIPHVFNDPGMIGFGSVSTSPPNMPQPLNSPVFSGAATADGNGYLLASADGGVFAFGDATFEGALGNLAIQGPIVAMATTTSGKGYWLGAMDGGVFSFGDAQFYGSMGATHLNQPVVGMAADGGIFTFGDAQFAGSAGNQNLPDSVVGMVASPDGLGYLIATANGVVLPFGDAQAFGGLQLDPTATQISAIIGNNHGTGYWLLDPQAWQYSFATNNPEGKFPGSDQIAAAVASQIEPDPSAAQGAFCNPYGPCEAWCALFATWAWERAGVPIPRYAFTGDVWTWSAVWGADLPPWATPDVGDAVLFGTGPQNASTSVHMAIVTQIWPDGALMTVGGDSGPGRDGALSVNIDGPFLPWDSASFNGMPIYGYSQP